jgi:dihydrofolate reductase
MSKVLWHATISADGFMTGPDDDMTWMAGYAGPNPAVEEVLPRIGAVLIGGRTFRAENGPTSEEGRPYGGAISVPYFVLTSRRETTPGYTFVDDLHHAVGAAREAAGERYVAVLGSVIARSCLAAGLLDEVLFHIAPVLLGSGTPVWDGKPVRLEPYRLTTTRTVINAWYQASSRA